MQQYPTNKIKTLDLYVKNFNQDQNQIDETIILVTNLTARGFQLGTSLSELNSQSSEWGSKMDKIYCMFVENMKNLKKVDDVVDVQRNLDLTIEGDTNSVKWANMYRTYQQLFENLESDVSVLTDAKDQIKKFESLGLILGEAMTTIESYIKNIVTALTTSLTDLDLIIQAIQEASLIILTDEQLAQAIPPVDSAPTHSPDVAAFYGMVNFGTSNQMFYQNNTNNKAIAWDRVVDGKWCNDHLSQIYHDNRSPLCDLTTFVSGVKTVTATPEAKLWKHIYYGFDLNDMRHQLVNTKVGNHEYSDQHGFQFTIDLAYDRSHDDGKPIYDHLKELFDANGMEGIMINWATVSMMYVVYSPDEISDFSGLTFRGVIVKPTS